MEERILKLEKELNELKAVYYKENYESLQVVRKDISLLGKTTSKGFIVTSDANTTGCHIHAGAAINDAGIKAEVGHTCPNGSQYMSSSTTQPFFIMVSTTWTLMNIP